MGSEIGSSNVGQTIYKDIFIKAPGGWQQWENYFGRRYIGSEGVLLESVINRTAPRSKKKPGPDLR